MRTTAKRIQKVTSKGQITLPAAWRRRVHADAIVVETKGDALTITPARLKESVSTGEYTVFDALRDNRGKGLKAADLLKMLKNIDG